MARPGHFNLTAMQVARTVDEPGMTYRLHRGPVTAKHATPDEGPCWCAPMPVTLEWVEAHTLNELQAALDDFYRSH